MMNLFLSLFCAMSRVWETSHAISPHACQSPRWLGHSINKASRSLNYLGQIGSFRVHGPPAEKPTHVKIYKACIYVTVWESSVFPWLLEGLTAGPTLPSPTGRTSASWPHQEKVFRCRKSPPAPPRRPPSPLRSARRSDSGHSEEAVIVVVYVRLHSKSARQSA